MNDLINADLQIYFKRNMKYEKLEYRYLIVLKVE